MDNQYNHYLDPEYYTKKELQRKEIKFLAYYTGFALICQIVLENILSRVIEFTGLTEKYLSDGIFQNCADIQKPPHQEVRNGWYQDNHSDYRSLCH